MTTLDPSSPSVPPQPVFRIARTVFDADYIPAAQTRTTTNFANLARGPGRADNLRRTLRMIQSRFNALIHWDNPTANRYEPRLEILSVTLHRDAGAGVPLFEMLDATILDHHTGTELPGITGHSFSSWLRDHDFSILRPRLAGAPLPADFGALHGRLFQAFVRSGPYAAAFARPPVICLSVSTSQTYRRTDNHHPLLGVEYIQDGESLTDQYFGRMGCGVRIFMPPGSVAPLAFYSPADVTGYSLIELASTIATMDTFQKIYRPEIHNAHAPAPAIWRPSLTQQDHALTRIDYDREERNLLAKAQGQFAEDHILVPHRDWLSRFAETAL